MDWEGNAGKGDWRNVRKVEWVPDHRTGNVDMDLLEQFRAIRTAPMSVTEYSLRLTVTNAWKGPKVARGRGGADGAIQTLYKQGQETVGRWLSRAKGPRTPRPRSPDSHLNHFPRHSAMLYARDCAPA